MYRFLRREEVDAEQLVQLASYGGGAPGIINSGTIDSAVAQPQASFDGSYLYADAFEMASAYLVSLIKGHGYANGNKRIGLSSALMFLFVNGVIIEATTDELVELVLGVIAGTTKREEAAEFFRAHNAVFISSTHALRIEGVQDSDWIVADASKWVNESFKEAFAILAQ